jgi:hypothetical protein
MFDGALLIVVGLLTVVWGRWLVPRWLRTVRERASPTGQESYDSFMKRPVVYRLFRISAPAGAGIMLIGLVYLIIEL